MHLGKSSKVSCRVIRAKNLLTLRPHFPKMGGKVVFLWHINLCRLFNAKSIFMKIVLFQTIQFIVSTVSMSKTVSFQIIPFSISTQFKCKYGLIVKNISIASYSV